MHPNLKTCNVAIYARCAVDTTGSAAIKDQVQRCLAFVERAGGDGSRTTVFADSGISGRRAQRPSYASLMAAVEDGRINAVVTQDLSRVTRDIAEASRIRVQLERAGVSLLTLPDC